MNADGRFLYGVTDESEYAPYGFNFKADAGKNQTILNMQQFQHAVLSGSGRSGYGKAGRSRQSHLYLSDTLTLRSRVNALKGTEFGDTLGRLRYDRVESVWSSLGRIKDTEVQHSSFLLCYAADHLVFLLSHCLNVSRASCCCLPIISSPQDGAAPVDRYQGLVDPCTLRQPAQRLLSSKWPQAPNTLCSRTFQCSLSLPYGSRE